MSFSTPGGVQAIINDPNGTTVNYWRIQGAPTNAGVQLLANGSDGSVSALYSTKGTSAHTFYTNNFAQGQFQISHTASAVNYVQVTGAATGGQLVISAQGSDTNIPFALHTKGNQAFNFYTNAGSQRQFRIQHTTSAVNFGYVTGGAAGGAVTFGVDALSSDTNIPLVLQPKGTGALQAQQTDSTATGGNARGANAVDWQTSRSAANQVASGTYSVVSGGFSNKSTGYSSNVAGGLANTSSAGYSFVGGGLENSASNSYTTTGGGFRNNATGPYNFVGGGYANSGTSVSAVTTQSATMNGTTAVTLSASNASIKVGQLISGTFIATYPADTYVAAISGTSLTLSQAASGSGTATLSFYTPHGVVVGGGNNQATGSYSFIGGGGDAGTAANRNVASGDWSFVGGGGGNTASGLGAVIVGGGRTSFNLYVQTASGSASFIGAGGNNTASGTMSGIVGGYGNTASGDYSMCLGRQVSSRGIYGNIVLGSAQSTGQAQAGLLVLNTQTTDATATVLASNNSAASTTNQVILPNNSAYYFKGSVIANVTGAANGAAWSFEGAIMRGANAASTVLIGVPSVNRVAASAGATAWTIALTADTTNGGLAVTVTGATSTTIRWVAKLETTEVTY
jgi:hypothetical protein